MPETPVVSIGLQRFDRTAALHDGRVRAEGVLVSQVLPAVGVRGLLEGAFDGAEIPLAHYTSLRARGEPYSALPVFPDRIFPQSYIFTTPDSGITKLGDLYGRRVCVPMYFMTSSIWHRGFLMESTGITPADIQWVTTAPERDQAINVPAGVSVTCKPGTHLGLEHLLNGDVDCLMTEATPLMTQDEAARVVKVVPDTHGAQIEFFQERAIHPIVHVVALHLRVLEQRPDVFATLCDAFDEALQASYDLLENERMVGLPLMRDYLDETARVFGDNPWPYGLEGRNSEELETFLGFAFEQGLVPRQLALDELFDDEAFAHQFRARTMRGADLGGLRSLLGVRGKTEEAT